MSATEKKAYGLGIHYDVPADIYHADPCDKPSLSSSLAHTLVTKTPAHAYLQHPRLGGSAAPKETTDSLTMGSLVDALLLGGWEQKIGVVEAGEFRTKVAKEEKAAHEAAGRVVVTRRVFDAAGETAEILRRKLAARGFKFNGKSQVMILWEEQSVYGPVPCRALLDHVFVEEGIIYDLKTIRAASADKCSTHVDEYGYDIQRAAYTRALDRYMVSPRFAGPDFVFLFCEVVPPHCVTPSRLDGTFRTIGEQRWQRAVDLFARCIRDNEWPEWAASTEVFRLEPRPWTVARELGA